MALNTSEAVKATEEIVQLELAIYERYTRAGVLYVKQNDRGQQQIYNFTKSQASILLQEVEDSSGRPVWRKPRLVRKEVQRQMERDTPAVIDATGDKTPVLEAIQPAGRIDVGTDDEVREILGDQADDLETV